MKARVLDRLRVHQGGETKAELVTKIAGTSAPTMQRVLKELEADGTIERDLTDNRWRLVDRNFRLSLDAPDATDLQAVMVAEAILGALVNEDLRTRLRSLAEQIDARVRERGVRPTQPATPIEVTMTSATRVDQTVLTRLLKAVRRETVMLEYTSPWSDERKRRLIEPWQLRLHDGAWYVRGWDRDASAPRTFRLVNAQRVTTVPHAGPPKALVPPRDQIWSEGDPAFGIDHDRPGTAVLVIAAPVSRWVAPIFWSPAQRDEWVGDTLHRTVPYESCRELARTVRTVADALLLVEPDELREEVFRRLDVDGRNELRLV